MIVWMTRIQRLLLPCSHNTTSLLMGYRKHGTPLGKWEGKTIVETYFVIMLLRIAVRMNAIMTRLKNGCM